MKIGIITEGINAAKEKKRQGELMGSEKFQRELERLNKMSAVSIVTELLSKENVILKRCLLLSALVNIALMFLTLIALFS